MKRKLILGFLAFFLLAGTAYAAGKSVSVYVNGKQVQSGQIIDGKTMLPLRAIAEALGASVEWDGKTYSAKITKPQQASQEATEGLSLAELNKIGESVGKVFAVNGTTYVSQGSGFIVNGNVFVTNWHVADEATSLRIEFGSKSVTVDVKNVLFKNVERDLFGIRVDGFPSLKLDTREPQNTDRVYALGFPSNKFQLSEGAVIGLSSLERDVIHNATTDNGSSGGVLINARGEVIGITDGGTDGTQYNHAIAAKYLQEELDKL